MKNFNKKKLKICTFNLENLFITNAKEPAHHLEKSQEKIRALAEVIKEINADIYFLCEVGGEASLTAFAEYYLNGKYKGSLIVGNSDRGIEIAYLIKSDLNFRFEHFGHRHRPIDYWNKVEMEENKIRLSNKTALIPSHKFSRDVAELRLFDPKSPTPTIPFLTLMGVHLKSKLDTDGLDFEGRGKREAEVKILTKISKTMFLYWEKKCPIIILGDFNGPALRESPDPEFTSLWAKNKLLGNRDLLEIIGMKIEDRTTFISVAHPSKNIPAWKQQLDYMLLSQDLHKNIDIKESGLYRFKSAGVTLPYPTTLQEKYSLPSDHYPIYVTLNLDQ